MKIILTVYYHLIESLLLASNYLKKCDSRIEVVPYPIFQKAVDIHCKLDNWVDDFVEFVDRENGDVIFWWYATIPTEDMKTIHKKCANVKHMFFNWDEPFNWKPNDLENKAKFFDAVFVTAEEKLIEYEKNGTKNAYCLYPAYCPKIHYPIMDDNDEIIKRFECDISICCTNLYDNDEIYDRQLFKRKDIIDSIYNNQKKYGYKFKIFGGEKIKSLYPDSYGGFVCYEDLNFVFNYSKLIYVHM
jgi:hypothetical protein